MPNDLQISIEESMEKLHYRSFDDWVTNFALNLENIWNEPSAAKLTPILTNNQGQNSFYNILNSLKNYKKEQNYENCCIHYCKTK